MTIRKFAIAALCICLTACGKPYVPVKSSPEPADVPDAALTAACDTSEGDPVTFLDALIELVHTRSQRDECAARMAGVAQWRKDALKRADQKPP